MVCKAWVAKTSASICNSPTSDERENKARWKSELNCFIGRQREERKARPKEGKAGRLKRNFYGVLHLPLFKNKRPDVKEKTCLILLRKMTEQLLEAVASVTTIRLVVTYEQFININIWPLLTFYI